jgi:hypothetical protein
MLVAPERREFSELIGVKMSPGVLLRKLQSRGVNIMPTKEDDFNSIKEITRKDDILSNEVLQQISRCANAFDFQSSAWSQSIEASKVGILVRESSVYTGIYVYIYRYTYISVYIYKYVY